MKLFSRKGLAFRLLSSFVLIIAIVLTIQTVAHTDRARKRLHDGLVRQGELLVDLLAYSSRVDVFTENKARLQDDAAGIQAGMDVVLVGFYGGNLSPLFVEKTTTRYPLSSGIEGAAAVAALKPDETLTREEKHTVEFVKPVVLRVNPTAESLYFGEAGTDQAVRIIGYVRIVMSKESLNRQMKSILLTNAVMGLIFIAMTIAAVFLWVKRIVRPIETLTERVKALGKGGEIERMPVETKDEIGGLAGAFNTMLDERAAAREAFTKIIMDIHDGIGGITTNISMLSEIAQRTTDPADIKKAVSTISNLSREGMMEIRGLMYSLDNKDLTWQTFSGELRVHGSRTLEPHGIAFEMTAEIEEAGAEPGTLLCLHLFKIYREALMNIVKHAKATKVSVNLRLNSERLLLQVRDNGEGFDEAALSGKGRGLANMKVRAAEIGGSVTIKADQGTTVSVEIQRPA